MTLKRVIDCDLNNEENRQSSIKIEKCCDFYSKNLRNERFFFLSLRSKFLIMIAICDMRFTKRMLEFDNVTVRTQKFYIYASFFFHRLKNFFFLIIFSDLWLIFFVFVEKINHFFVSNDFNCFSERKIRRRSEHHHWEVKTLLI